MSQLTTDSTAREFFQAAIAEIEVYLDHERDREKCLAAQWKRDGYRQLLIDQAWGNITGRTPHLEQLTDELRDIIAGSSPGIADRALSGLDTIIQTARAVLNPPDN